MINDSDSYQKIELKTLKEAFSQNTFFDNKTWKYSPNAWELSKEQAWEIEKIGEACLDFYKAAQRLYFLSYHDKPILRNSDMRVPWVAQYLNRGKPKELIEHGVVHNFEKALPAVIRPDLLITEDGFALTELDCVPGGIGLTSFLYRLYEKESPNLVGSHEDMLLGFYESLADLVPKKENPRIAILVDPAEDIYLPELEYLAKELSARGKNIMCCDTRKLETLLPEVDIIYRFFELYNMGKSLDTNKLYKAVEDGVVLVSPPMKSFQEEKLNLALLHHPKLECYWREALGKAYYKLLMKIVPKSWVLDPTEIGPNAELIGPYESWDELKKATQKQRNYIIKISGFHESSWGAASVSLGADMSHDDWDHAVDEGLKSFKNNPFIIQEYLKPKRIRHMIYRDQGEEKMMYGRTRLCPYYYVGRGKKSKLGGILATFCPEDKKIIHGMKDAALLPCKTA